MKFWLVALVLVLAIGFVASPAMACDPDGCGDGCGGGNGGGCGHGGCGGHKCDPNDDDCGGNGGGCGGGGCPTNGH